nr:abscisic acid-insensitive 5-like protein 2 [Quercus suber]
MGDRTMVVSPNRGQGSLYNLTFDEVQSHLGNNICKPLNTMNLDELLRNLMSVEEGQLVQNTSSSSSALLFLKNLNLNGTLRKKTVDELWKEIVHKQHVNEMEKEQSTLGETTLEEFLVRAGVISPQPIMAIDPMVMVSQQADWLQFQMAAVQQQHQQQQQQMIVLDSSFNVSESVYENPVLDVRYSENQLALSMPMPAISSASSDSQVAAERKRRCSDEMMEKAIERRQKRMIKNRESAARSRARKQVNIGDYMHFLIVLMERIYDLLDFSVN